MLKIIKAEKQKQKHTFLAKLPLIAPCINIFLAFLFMGGMKNLFPMAAWNWWYTTLLPGMTAILCYFNISKERKIKYFSTMGIGISCIKSWYGKVFYIAIEILVANMISCIGIAIVGIRTGTTIWIGSGVLTGIVLTITMLWMIPMLQFFSGKFGLFLTVFMGLFLSIIGVAIFAESKWWWLFPSAILNRLMCPVLGVRPNGLAVEVGNPLGNRGVIIPGILCSVLWFFLISFFTAKWFQHMEEK